MIRLYTDGGVILKNPSPIGGTWAWILADKGDDGEDEVLGIGSGVVIPNDAITFSKNGTVTNNQTELFAILQGLSNLSDDAVVRIKSDSNVSLGRVFHGSSFSNIPSWMVTSLRMEQKRLKNWKQFRYTLLDGHPTKSHLSAGIGKRGHPVSKWNVVCDQLCHNAANNYLEENPRILSTFRESEKLKISL